MAITYITQRTATSGTAASSGTLTVTVPTGTVPSDILILAVANAGTAGPTTAAGWTLVRPTDSAGSGQSITCFWARYTPALTLSFINAASAAAWCCNSYSGGDVFVPIDTSAAASNTTNNTTLPTGAPTSGAQAGDYEVLCYCWTSAATISAVASGSTIDKTQANGTSVSCAIGHNNTTSINGSTATSAFSQTLSASNRAKTGVGILLRPFSGTSASIGHPFILF